MIHKTAIINPKAEIHPSVEIGPYAIIGENVIIEENTIIGAYSYIEYAHIGKNCKIAQSVCIGTAPQDFKYKGNVTYAIIGNNCTVREFSTIHRGSSTEKTLVGDGCYLMAYSHIGHDCCVGKEVIMANVASLGGHVYVEDYVVFGALAAAHQFVRIGKLSMIGAGSMVTLDVPPYMLACGDRVKLYGLNLVGLKRRKYSDQVLKRLKDAYRILFLSKRRLSDALDYLESINQNNDENITHLINFIRNTKRGICRPNISSV